MARSVASVSLRWPIAASVSLAALDQATKALVRHQVEVGESVQVIPGFAIVLRQNLRGFSWWVPELPEWAGLVLGGLLLLILVGAFPLYAFHSARRRRSPWAAGAAVLLSAAAGGHLADPLFVPYATDWISLAGLPAFNLADLWAYVGLGCLAVELWWVHGQAQGLGLGQRWRRALETRREFLGFLGRGVRFRR
jgi:signal peptidase II